MQGGQKRVYSCECEAVFSCVIYDCGDYYLPTVTHPAIAARNHKGLALGKAPFFNISLTDVFRRAE